MSSQFDEVQHKNITRNFIDKFERHIRLFIEEELKSYYKDDWWESGIPNSIRIRILNTINNLKKQNPKRTYKKSELFTFNDYKDIILYKTNWLNIFKSIFHEKINVSYPLNKLRLIRNDLSHVRKLNKKDLLKIGAYTDDIFKFIPTESTLEDLDLLNIKIQDSAERYISLWEEKIEKIKDKSTIAQSSTAIPNDIKIKNHNKAETSVLKTKKVSLPIITTDRIMSVLSTEWLNIKHLIFKLKIKEMMDARYLQLKLKELERKGQVLVEVKMGRKHWKLFS